MPKIGRLWVDLETRRGNFDSSMLSAHAVSGNLTSQFGKLSSVLRNVAPWALAGGAVVKMASTFKYAVEKTLAFETQLSRVSTMLQADTIPMIHTFRTGMLDLAVEFGESTDVLSRGLYDILSASVSASKAMNVLRVSVMAAKGGFTTTAISADVITTVLNAYQLQAEKAEQVSDVLFMTVARGKTTFGELASQMGQIVTIASSTGIALEELTAAVATMTRAGLSTADAITSVRSMIMNFMKPAQEAAEAARRFGFELSVTTLAAEGLGGIMERMAMVPATEWGEIFPRIEAIRGIAALMTDLKGFLEDTKMMWDAAGESARAARTAMNTLEQERLRGEQRREKMLVEAGPPSGVSEWVLTWEWIKTQAVKGYTIAAVAVQDARSDLNQMIYAPLTGERPFWTAETSTVPTTMRQVRAAKERQDALNTERTAAMQTIEDKEDKERSARLKAAREEEERLAAAGIEAKRIQDAIILHREKTTERVAHFEQQSEYARLRLAGDEPGLKKAITDQVTRGLLEAAQLRRDSAIEEDQLGKLTQRRAEYDYKMERQAILEMHDLKMQTFEKEAREEAVREIQKKQRLLKRHQEEAESRARVLVSRAEAELQRPIDRAMRAVQRHIYDIWGTVVGASTEMMRTLVVPQTVAAASGATPGEEKIATKVQQLLEEAKQQTDLARRMIEKGIVT